MVSIIILGGSLMVSISFCLSLEGKILLNSCSCLVEKEQLSEIAQHRFTYSCK